MIYCPFVLWKGRGVNAMKVPNYAKFGLKRGQVNTSPRKNIDFMKNVDFNSTNSLLKTIFIAKQSRLHGKMK